MISRFRYLIIGLLLTLQVALLFHTFGSQTKPVSTAELRLRSQHYPPIRIFAGVLSLCAHREARQAIRTTWATDPLFETVLFFTARCNSSMDIHSESQKYQDIVMLENVTEGYYHITHQTYGALAAAASLTLSTPHHPITHVLKTDDDTYIHAQRLQKLVEKSPRESVYIGHLESNNKPQRDPASQWYISQEQWPREVYPTWAHGVAFLLSIDLVKAIVSSGTAWRESDTTTNNNELFPLEDVAVGIWVERMTGEGEVHYVSDRRFNFGGCRVSDIASHYVTPSAMACMHAQQGRCCKG